MLVNWNNRSIFSAYLYNPAFCGEVLIRCIKEYEKKVGDKNVFKYSLAFLCLPLLVSKPFSTKIPYNYKGKKMEDWVKASNLAYNPSLELMIKAFIPYTKEAIHFLYIYDKIRIDKSKGTISLLGEQVLSHSNDDETEEIFVKAKVIGEMFASINDDTLIYELFNLKPI